MVRILISTILILFASLAHGEVLFEGYFKIMSNDKAIGYIIS
jgi:hypothetical protein